MNLLKKINLEKSGFIEAKAITKKNAKTFYFASRFLNKEKRDAAYSVYAICRLSDEAVDNEQSFLPSEILIKMKKNIELAYANGELREGILSALRRTIVTYRIPQNYFSALLEGMYMDLKKKRYQNFDELYDYSYKVAGVAGLIMAKIFGYHNPEAEKYALNLGIAMQLTNILRDIKEDYHRGRIYLPQKEMQQYGIKENSIAGERIDDDFKALLKFQIERARGYYRKAQVGIKLISNLRSRFVVIMMKNMYEAILNAIEKNGYDVFSKRAHVNIIGKIGILLKTIIKGEYL